MFVKIPNNFVKYKSDKNSLCKSWVYVLIYFNVIYCQQHYIDRPTSSLLEPKLQHRVNPSPIHTLGYDAPENAMHFPDSNFY